MLNKADRACVQFLRASTSVRLIAENDSGDRVTISLNKRQQGGVLRDIALALQKYLNEQSVINERNGRAHT